MRSLKENLGYILIIGAVIIVIALIGNRIMIDNQKTQDEHLFNEKVRNNFIEVAKPTIEALEAKLGRRPTGWEVLRAKPEIIEIVFDEIIEYRKHYILKYGKKIETRTDEIEFKLSFKGLINVGLIDAVGISNCIDSISFTTKKPSSLENKQNYKQCILETPIGRDGHEVFNNESK